MNNYPGTFSNTYMMPGERELYDSHRLLTEKQYNKEMDFNRITKAIKNMNYTFEFRK